MGAFQFFQDDIPSCQSPNQQKRTSFLPWWKNLLSLPIMLICHCVTTSAPSSQLITTMSSINLPHSATSQYYCLITYIIVLHTKLSVKWAVMFLWLDWAPIVSVLTVFTPRVVSTAVARYNFAARDMRELSLREGDTVKIYSKIGGDQGWWKGEANGRIGWFPSTYVDEEGVQ